jgi:hypothetical protein
MSQEMTRVLLNTGDVRQLLFALYKVNTYVWVLWSLTPYTENQIVPAKQLGLLGYSSGEGRRHLKARLVGEFLCEPVVLLPKELPALGHEASAADFFSSNDPSPSDRYRRCWVVYLGPVREMLICEGPERMADDDRFPHSCPRCKSPAYVGFTSVECSRGRVCG